MELLATPRQTNRQSFFVLVLAVQSVGRVAQNLVVEKGVPPPPTVSLALRGRRACPPPPLPLPSRLSPPSFTLMSIILRMQRSSHGWFFNRRSFEDRVLSTSTLFASTCTKMLVYEVFCDNDEVREPICSRWLTTKPLYVLRSIRFVAPPKFIETCGYNCYNVHVSYFYLVFSHHFYYPCQLVRGCPRATS